MNLHPCVTTTGRVVQTRPLCFSFFCGNFVAYKSALVPTGQTVASLCGARVLRWRRPSCGAYTSGNFPVSVLSAARQFSRRYVDWDSRSGHLSAYSIRSNRAGSCVRNEMACSSCGNGIVCTYISASCISLFAKQSTGVFDLSAVGFFAPRFCPVATGLACGSTRMLCM